MLTVFICAAAWGQSIERGSITGTITDPNGDRMPGVNVTLTSGELGTTSETMTDANGRYRFVALLPSTYTVAASIEGFSTAQQEDIVLTVNQTLTVDLTMQLGSVEDIIIVEGSPLIDVRSSTLQTTELNNEILMEVPTQRSIRASCSWRPASTPRTRTAGNLQPSVRPAWASSSRSMESSSTARRRARARCPSASSQSRTLPSSAPAPRPSTAATPA